MKNPKGYWQNAGVDSPVENSNRLMTMRAPGRAFWRHRKSRVAMSFLKLRRIVVAGDKLLSSGGIACRNGDGGGDDKNFFNF